MAEPPSSPRGPSVLAIPDGDNRERMVCPDCGFINYENPKIVVGAVCLWQERILLCRRAINPRRGFWTLPAGYLELHESTPAGAIREAWEEAQAKITIDGLLAIYDIPRISQVQVIYRARLAEPGVEPGPESLEVARQFRDECEANGWRHFHDLSEGPWGAAPHYPWRYSARGCAGSWW